MASIIRNEMAGALAASYLDKFGQGSSANDNLFMVIGKAEAWADENSPDVPDGSYNTKANFEQLSIAAKRIEKTNVQMVIPRRTWVNTTVYAIVNDGANDPLAATDFYVVNSNSEVFICTTTSGGASTIEPTKALADGNIGNTKFTPTLADGYVWEYMYTVSGNSSKADTTQWLPVSYGPSIVAGEDIASYRRLGVDNIMIIGEIDETITYTGDDYRQIAIYKNLADISDGVSLVANNEYQIVGPTWAGADNELSGLVSLATSDMIYLENRIAITRVSTQVEELKVILSLG